MDGDTDSESEHAATHARQSYSRSSHQLGCHLQDHSLGSCHSLGISLDADDIGRKGLTNTSLGIGGDDDGGAGLSLDLVH